MKYAIIAALGLILCAATPRPAPTATPVALQYVEVSKIVMPGAQPEPGSFAADFKAAMSAPATPGSERGRAVRYTFYYTKGWIREDDFSAQRATISKCPQHQFITLNLAQKTYKITDTSPKGCPAPTQGGPPRPGGVDAAPGTMDVSVQSTAKDLGAKTIEGIPTNGTDSNNDLPMTNATGSCMNMKMSSRQISYISSIRKPRAYCPLVTGGYTGGVLPSGAMGGCVPTMHTNGGGGIGMISDNLEMWVLSLFNGGAGSLMERGQVAWLSTHDADPLFAVPTGFTEEK